MGVVRVGKNSKPGCHMDFFLRALGLSSKCDSTEEGEERGDGRKRRKSLRHRVADSNGWVSWVGHN